MPTNAEIFKIADDALEDYYKRQVMSPEEAAKKKKRILNPDGTYSSERTITIGVEGGYINIPTIWEGKQLSQEQAVKRAKNSGIQYKRYKTIEEAVKAAGERSRQLGIAGKKLKRTGTITDKEVFKIADDALEQYRKRQQTGFPSLEPETKFDLTPLEVAEKVKLGGATFLGRIIDVLSRGEYASAAMAKDYLMGKPFDLESAWKGFKGEDKITYDQLVSTMRPDWGPWKQKALGFSLAIFADPTTYIPAGVIAKGVGKTTKAIKATKAAQKLAETRLAKAFIPGAGLPKSYYEMRYYAQKGAEAERGRILDDIKFLRKDLTKQDMDNFSYYREHPDKISEMPAKLQDKLEVIGSRFDDLIDEGVKAEIITPEIAAKWRAKEIPYVTHLYEGRPIRIVSGELPPNMFNKVKQPTFLKRRTFETMEDAEEVSKQFGDIANAKTLDEAYSIMKGEATVSTLASKQIIEEVGSSKTKDILAYYQNLYPELRGLKIRGLKPTKESGPLIDEGVAKIVFDKKGNLDVEKSAIHITRDASPITVRHEIEHFLNALQSKELKPQTFTDYTHGDFAKEYLEKKGIEVSFQKYDLTDAFAAPDLDELNRLKKAAQAGESLYKSEKNILKALAVRRLEQVNVIARKRFVDDVLKEFGEPVKAGVKIVAEDKGIYYPKGHLRIFAKELVDPQSKAFLQLIEKYDEFIPAEEIIDLMKTYPMITKKVKAYMMPKAVAQDMNRGMALFSGDPATRGFWKLFDKGQNVWKGMATVVRLPFHWRNGYSNWWQAWLSGMNNPARFIQAARLQKGAIKEIKLGDKVYDVATLKKAIDDFGIHGKGWVGADIPTRYMDELESIIKAGKLKHLNPFKLGRKFGIMIEDNARIAVFIDQLAKGKSFKDASRAVRKYLFDYSELTEFEKKVMRRIWPFYTWSRKNIPLQIANVLKQPRKYQAYAKGQRAFREKETQKELNLKFEYFNELLYIKSPWRSKQDKPIYMSFDLPPQEFNRMTSARHWLSSISPYKLLAEVGLNIKFFPEISPIKKYPLDMGRAPFWVMYLPKKLQNMMAKRHIIDQQYNPETDETIMVMDKKWRHAFQSALPFLNELNRIYAQPVSLSDETPQMKWRAYLSGIGFAALDTEFQEKREIWTKMKEVGPRGNIEKFILQRGRMPTDEELKILAPNTPEIWGD